MIKGINAEVQENVIDVIPAERKTNGTPMLVGIGVSMDPQREKNIILRVAQADTENVPVALAFNKEGIRQMIAVLQQAEKQAT